MKSTTKGRGIEQQREKEITLKKLNKIKIRSRKEIAKKCTTIHLQLGLGVWVIELGREFACVFRINFSKNGGISTDAALLLFWPSFIGKMESFCTFVVVA